jgi:hypothetical protein
MLGLPVGDRSGFPINRSEPENRLVGGSSPLRPATQSCSTKDFLIQREQPPKLRGFVYEASFFVTDDALRRIAPNMQFDESGILSAFDLNRNLIYAIAAKVYGRGRKGSYELVAADF